MITDVFHALFAATPFDSMRLLPPLFTRATALIAAMLLADCLR